jgi:imidazolonepropionase-like amidohydrolase
MVRFVRLLCVALLFTACASNPAPETQVDLVLKNVDVVDLENATILPRRDILIEDGRITAVQESRDDPALRAVRTVDVRGQYLIPALWDLHVHLESITSQGNQKLDPRRWHAPLSMSYGVLGLRDMGSRTDDILTLRTTFNAIRESGEPAPLLRVAGQSFMGPMPWGPAADHTLRVETPTQAAELVRSQIARGVDFIKVHDFLAPDVYRAIVTTARAEGKTVSGHLRPYSGPIESAALGQLNFDHMPPELLAYCGANGRRDTDAFYGGWFTAGPGYYEREMTRLYNAAGCQAMFRELGARAVSVTPTLSVRAPVRDRTFAAAGRYLPGGQMKICTESRASFDKVARADLEAYRAMSHKVVRDLDAAGVNILTGTDGTPESCGVPGLILLDELDELVEAGLPRAQVLHEATTGAARLAGAGDSGAVKPGALADLVLLSANPLDGFATLEDPAGVVSAGQYMSKSDLGMLRESAAAYARTLNPQP